MAQFNILCHLLLPRSNPLFLGGVALGGAARIPLSIPCAAVMQCHSRLRLLGSVLPVSERLKLLWRELLSPNRMLFFSMRLRW